ncbi:hypothetical protein ABI013_15170, partial [Enterococcus faecium]|uniref:hypothetical protein n=1 Tax=Enterococcus faecium TaxID=1352 RepID=UPI003F41C2ED
AEQRPLDPVDRADDRAGSSRIIANGLSVNGHCRRDKRDGSDGAGNLALLHGDCQPMRAFEPTQRLYVG